MPGVQCVICLSSDTSSEDWCVLRECGHVFHTHCIDQSLEHNRKCPQCRLEYSRRKYNSHNPPYQRIFFEFSTEPASQPVPDANDSSMVSGGSAADLQQLAFLQSQLRDKDRRIQAISTQLAETEEQVERLERDVALARTGMRDKEMQLQEKIKECSQEHKKVKGMANHVANLEAKLKTEAARASLYALATDHSLVGGALRAEVDKLVQLGLKAPNDFWEKLMSERSQVIIASSNKHGREKAALERRQQQLQAEMDQLQEQVANLKRSLAAGRQQQPGSGAASQVTQAMLVPRLNSSTAGAGRHAIRRFGAAASKLAWSAGPAGAAPAEEDPLVHTYELLNMRQADLAAAASSRRSSQHQPQQQQAPVAAAPATQRPPSAGTLAPCTAAAAVGGPGQEEDELVVLDDSEEQMEAGTGGCYSEVESDAEEEDQVGHQAAVATATSSEQLHGAASWQQLQQQGGTGSFLGKRSSSGPAAMHGRRSVQGSGNDVAGCLQISAHDENCANSSGNGGVPLLAAAGPGRIAMQHAPGRSFIRNSAAASLGIDRGKFISSGPDGMGGVATAYQGSSRSGPVRLSQKQIDVRAMQSQPGGSKKARLGSVTGGGETATAAAALRRNNALPITSFFSKVQQ